MKWNKTLPQNKPIPIKHILYAHALHISVEN